MLLLSCFAGAVASSASADDLESMQGIWQLVACERAGNAYSDSDLDGATIVFAGDLMTVNIKGRSASYRFALQADTAPKGIDVEIGEQTGRGAYELKVDSLRIVHGEVGGDRPTAFGTTAGSGRTLLVLQRMPPSELCSILDLVEQVKRADFEGDRASLRELHDRLTPFAANESYGDKVLYWQGFALWRRAINGFNETVDRTEQEQDLADSIRDFEAALGKNPDLLDARVGIICCHGLVVYLDYTPNDAGSKFGDEAKAKERIGQMVAQAKIVAEASPDHPRLLWVQGPSAFAGGDASKALEMYERAQKSLRESYSQPFVPLAPTWGEPELLMAIAYTLLNQSEPDLAGAENAAREALAIAPHWHYVKDILLPQILDAKSRAAKPTQ